MAWGLYHWLPSSPAEATFLNPTLQSLLLVYHEDEGGQRKSTNESSATTSAAILSSSPANGRSRSSSFSSQAEDSPKLLPSNFVRHARASSQTPLTAPPMTERPKTIPPYKSLLSSPTLQALISPITLSLSLGYLLLLLSTTPSAFLPRILQSRFAMSEQISNLLVGFVYALGGCLQFLVGWWAEKKGVSEVWRIMSMVVCLSWLAVGMYEGLILRGGGVVGAEERTIDVDWIGSGFGRWMGVSLRILATMGQSRRG